jgi:hypothetical protein
MTGMTPEYTLIRGDAPRLATKEIDAVIADK